MSDGRRLGGAGRLAASLSSLTGSLPRGFAASVRVSGISPRAAERTVHFVSGKAYAIRASPGGVIMK
jgi:hypothetical protein